MKLAKQCLSNSKPWFNKGKGAVLNGECLRIAEAKLQNTAFAGVQRRMNDAIRD